MPGTKEDLRAEIATLREELAAERGRNEVLREQARQAHGCGCAHASWYWCVTCNGLRWPGHTCTYITWTSQPYQVTCGGAGAVAFPQSGAATGAGLDATTYTLS